MKLNYFQHNNQWQLSPDQLVWSWSLAQQLRPELLNYVWRLFKPQQNQLTRQIASSMAGYVLALDRSISPDQPVKIRFVVDQNNFTQAVRNLIVLRAGVRATLEIDCSSCQCFGARHLSLTEVFLEPGARLDLHMNHAWDPNATVRPLLSARLAKEAQLIYRYRCLQAPASLVSSPKIILAGDGAKFTADNRLRVASQARIKIGNRVWLKGTSQSAQLVTKIVSDGGQAFNHDQITATGASQGHIECDGLLLNNRAMVASVPSIIARSPQAELSHEASIGKLNPEQVEYLMTRGLTRLQAIELLISGFLAEKRL
jgi:uncharacterized protein